ncbi:DUF1800 domain-containing protein [Gilvimarinus polysaccharolyticus]|uniref:DUF1800 domain-containing protein n=1 Tax=Gilvimarinus polysaccharolyticus TaxID=863921 RepID=UPI000A01CE37|nr:DUF1800 domain-containing protein [Gilvimarinus polysaccharolyticus]
MLIKSFNLATVRRYIRPSSPALISVLILALISCGGGSGSSNAGPSDTPPPSTEPTPAPVPEPEPTPEPEPSLITELPAYNTQLWPDAVKAARFLQQTTFGPTQTSVLEVLNKGETAWLQEQLNMPPTLHLPLLDERFLSLGWQATPDPEAEGAEGYYRDLQRSDIWWEVVLRSEDQLRQRVAFALSQIFVISNVSDVLYNDTRGIASYQDMLLHNAFGNYRELLESVTLHPMMGEYLSMVRNEKANPEKNIRPDENYAREVMQLFSIGLVELNIDGTVKKDTQEKPIPTYNQDIIKAFARIFTGWNFATTNQWWQWTSDAIGETLPMKAYQQIHDSDAKTLLNNTTLPAGQTAEQDMSMALDNLFNHPNVGPFISKQLIQRLVTSNPSAAYVERAARVFNDNGLGVRGDMQALVRSILTDTEAQNGHTQKTDTFGKLREPILQLANIWRTFNAQGIAVLNAAGTQTTGKRIRYLSSDRKLGQRPFGSFSVFNFYRPDYSHSGNIKTSELLAPEFQIHTESVMIAKTNSLTEAIFWRDIDETWVQNQQAGYDWDIAVPAIDITTEKNISSDASALIDRLDLLLTAGQIDSAARDLLIEHIDNMAYSATDEYSKRLRVFDAASLIVASPYYAIQR